MYTFLIWGHSHINSQKMDNLHKINKLVCKMLNPVRHTTPRKSQEVIHDLIPLNLLSTYKAITALTRQEEHLHQDWIGTNAKHKTYIGHRKYWYDIRGCLMSNRQRKRHFDNKKL